MKIRVRSIFTKIVVWAVATVVISLVGFVVTSAFVSARISGRNAELAALEHRCSWTMPAERFKDGGPERLDAFLKRLNDHTESEHFLTDGRGIDLVTGEDRSALRPSGPSAYRSPLGRFLPRTETTVRVRRSRDGRFRLITVVPPPAHFDPWESSMVFPLAAALDRRALLSAGGAPGLAVAKSPQGGRAVRTRRAGRTIRADPERRDRRAGTRRST